MKKLKGPILAGIIVIVLAIIGGTAYFKEKSSSSVNTGFQKINELFATDNNHVYILGPKEGARTVLQEADLKTFISTGKFSAKDANHTYGTDAKGYLEIDGVSTHYMDSSDNAIENKFSAIPTSGLAPFKVTFTIPPEVVGNDGYIDFGDGSGHEFSQSPSEQNGPGLDSNYCNNDAVCIIEHTYSSSGVYEAKLDGGFNVKTGGRTTIGTIQINAGNTTTITVGNGKVSATIDTSTLSAQSGTPTIKGSAQGLSSINVSIGFYSSAKGGSVLAATGMVPVVNGKWSFNIAKDRSSGWYNVLPDGDYVVSVSPPSTNSILVKGNLHISSVQDISATIDSSSLISVGNPTLKGTAGGLSKVTVSIGSFDVKCGQGDYYVNTEVPIVNGKWSIKVVPPNNYVLPSCNDYTVGISTGSGATITPLAKGTLIIK
ncbi:MAG: hypothetical protein JWN37_911 [Candidatus Nomurabacteria bacterium]|nr:hypothetical protein [Candidatus Nomurabacteria bacterium]